MMTAKTEIHWFCPPCKKGHEKQKANEKSCEEGGEVFLKKLKKGLLSYKKNKKQSG